MNNQYKRILLGVMCIICLQVSFTAYANELPFVPVEESSTVSVTVNETSAEQSPTISDSSNPTVSSTITTEKSDTEEKSTLSGKNESSSESMTIDESTVIRSDSDGNDLPVISPDGRQVEITSAANNSLSSENKIADESKESTSSTKNSGDIQKSDNSLAEESNYSGEKAVSHTENSETPESKDGSNFPIMTAIR